MLKQLADLFQEFEAAVQDGVEIDHEAWAKRAFETIMGKTPDMDEEDSAYRYPDVDKSKYRA